ncbi:MAG: hypothetical protein JWN18_737 [Parcubacteria group bacterium]|nr:hypothetical protein [Parcubacteria group bacterium]
MNTNSFSELFENGGVRIALIGALSILSLFLLAETITAASNFGRSNNPATDTITVDGTGRATLAPDVAHVSFTVQNTAATVAEAQALTTKQANAAIDFVKKQGIAEKDVRTLSYNINPQYSYPNPCTPGAGRMCPTYSGNAKITGYEVSEMIQVTERDISKVGELLAGLGTLGVQNVNGPDFALDNANAGYIQARAEAISDARTQAELLAKQLGVRLGKIVNFNESNNGNPMPMYEAMSANMKAVDSAAAPVIPAGENTYTASVSVTYEIR